jgi:hypothetical protein
MSEKPIYQYTWKTGWTNKSSTAYKVSESDIKSDLKTGMSKAMIDEFSKKFAELGRWFIVDSINVDIAKFSKTLDYPYIPLPYAPCTVEAEGTTTVIFRSDATPEQEFSPQGWEEILLSIIALVETAILTHGTLFFVLLIIIALTIFALAGGFKGVLFGGGGGGGLGDIGTIIAISIIGIGGLILLSSYLGKGKGRRR